MKFKNKLLLYTSIAFVLFACATILLQVVDEHKWKSEILQSKLEGYCDIIQNVDSLATIHNIAPAGVRVTIISNEGDVLYDSNNGSIDRQNHNHRPEIVDCLEKGVGYSIRKSETLERKYFYFAKKYDNRIIRVAQDYDIDLKKYFRFDLVLLIAIFSLFAITLIIVIRLAKHYERGEAEAAKEKTKRLKHEMTGNISHELKTPVSSIMGYLETILAHPDLSPERKQQFLERSYGQAVRLSDIIRDISLITKLEEKPNLFEITPINVQHLVDDIIEEMRKPISEHNILVNNQLHPIGLRANERLLYAIFRNLLENSVKYGGDGCYITISYKGNENGVHLFEYQDNGRGVPHGELEKIFTRFYRMDKDRTNEGSGLGLSIVRNAVYFHNGDIEAFIPENGGLGFRFSIDSATPRK